MGVQISCPLCGWNREKDSFNAKEVCVKDTRSLGGDNGFEHVEIEPPEDVESHIQSEVTGVFHKNSGILPGLLQGVEDHAESFTILWDSLDEFLVQTRVEIESEPFHLTGPELFQQYDLPLMARQRRYYFVLGINR